LDRLGLGMDCVVYEIEECFETLNLYELFLGYGSNQLQIKAKA